MPAAPPDAAFLAHLRDTLAALLGAPNIGDSPGQWADDAGRALSALVDGAATVTLGPAAAPPAAAPGGRNAAARSGTRVEVTIAAGPAAEVRVVCGLRSPADAARVRAVLDAVGPALAAGAALRLAPASAASADGATPPRGTAPVPRTTDQALRSHFGLTARQLEVVALLLRGRRNADIAASLGTSAATARHHTERVLAKLGARSRAEVPGIVATRLAALTAATAAADGVPNPAAAGGAASGPALAEAR